MTNAFANDHDETVFVELNAQLRCHGNQDLNSVLLALDEKVSWNGNDDSCIACIACEFCVNCLDAPPGYPSKSCPSLNPNATIMRLS
jgi:hypothetical protein